MNRASIDESLKPHFGFTALSKHSKDKNQDSYFCYTRDMILEPTTAVPLREDEHGLIRIGQTRVTLQSLMLAWKQGSSPEELIEQFPALRLDDVYAVIAFVLRHREDVETYIRKVQNDETTALEHLSLQFPQAQFRERILARAKSQGLR